MTPAPKGWNPDVKFRELTINETTGPFTYEEAIQELLAQELVGVRPRFHEPSIVERAMEGTYEPEPAMEDDGYFEGEPRDDYDYE